ncbi:MAG: 3-isopropylmalate dehydratase small subunit [Bryobacterales bacterium]|nr:3-isopropylmalate dehydratase small subunit [Bryobacterales bacterium]
MEPVTGFRGKVVPLPVSDIDTDQIIPARFLKTIEKLGLGDNLFHDWRYLPGGGPNPDFVLNQPRARNATILLAGDNFGCGSSREHAPWALLGFGFRAVISTSFADIFRNNCLKNGLLPVAVDTGTLSALFKAAGADDSLELEIDLASQTLTLPGGQSTSFPVDDFSRQCLLAGGDQLSYIQQRMEAVTAYEAESPDELNTLA